MKAIIFLGLFFIFNIANACDTSYNVAFVNCLNDRECSFRGRCYNGTCHCSDGYITYDSDTGCGYTQQKQLTVFLLALFVGEFGVDQFVLGNTKLGVGKLLYTLSICFIACVAGCIGYRFNTEYSLFTVPIFTIFKFLWMIGMFTWWIHDVIVAGTCSETDNNGAPMQNW